MKKLLMVLGCCFALHAFADTNVIPADVTFSETNIPLQNAGDGIAQIMTWNNNLFVLAFSSPSYILYTKNSQWYIIKNLPALGGMYCGLTPSPDNTGILVTQCGSNSGNKGIAIKIIINN